MYVFPHIPKEEERKLSPSCQAFKINHKAKIHAWNIMNFVSKKPHKTEKQPLSQTIKV